MTVLLNENRPIDYWGSIMKEAAKKVKLVEPVDVDKILVSRDHYFSNAYIVDLPLESTPDHVWQDIFEGEWKSSRHLWDRKLFVVGDSLRLVTTASDFEDKIDWVKQVIAETNKAIDEYNKGRGALGQWVERQAKSKAAAEEQADVEMIRTALRKTIG
jgi:hypothetical protein